METSAELGHIYWQYTERHKNFSEIIRLMSVDKALDPDFISVTWLRKDENAYPLYAMLREWVNGNYIPPTHLNDARLMLPSKNGASNPPVDKVRMIAIVSAMKKAMESQ